MSAADTMPPGTSQGTPQVLLSHHLKQLRLPTVLASTTRLPASVPATASTIRATCCGCSSWS